MKIKTTKYTLLQSFLNGKKFEDKLDIINAIEREDGSGHHFNISGFKDKKEITIFVTTLD
jgi:hypothetical protein